MKKSPTKKSAQDIQDEIFKKMSVNKKFLLFAQFWKLAKNVAPQNPLWKEATHDTSSSPPRKF